MPASALGFVRVRRTCCHVVRSRRTFGLDYPVPCTENSHFTTSQITHTLAPVVKVGYIAYIHTSTKFIERQNRKERIGAAGTILYEAS